MLRSLTLAVREDDIEVIRCARDCLTGPLGRHDRKCENGIN